MSISSNSTVHLHFNLILQDGTLAESSHSYQKPGVFTLGDGTFSPAIEQQLLGLKVGEKKRFSLNPEEAFGLRDEDKLHPFDLSVFPPEMELEEGLIVTFEQPNKQEMPGVIRQIENALVWVDFNHPLAGQHLIMDVEIIHIEQ